ncbi:MAG: cupin domain-containing protein [Candidatus Electrothrix sp. YB6]
MKPFSQWTIAEVERKFHLNRRSYLETLEQWLQAEEEITPEEEKLFTAFHERLQNHIWDWNEQELKGKFIFPLLAAINFDNEQSQVFIEREISVAAGNTTLSGTVDLLVAGGRGYPERPYCFTCVFSQEQEGRIDPLGRLLIAMVAVQKLNDDNRPIYGCYVTGRLWFFVVLEGKYYAAAPAYDATKDGIREIFFPLKAVKTITAEYVISEAEKKKETLNATGNAEEKQLSPLLMNNIFVTLPADLKHERFDELLRDGNVRIERIVSKGHVSPKTGWYDERENEWILILQGAGTILFDDDSRITLREGDYLHIPAYARHKVVWTEPDELTVWLAVHYPVENIPPDR